MKTYSETEGRPIFDWNKTLKELVDNNGDISNEEHDALVDRSRSWVTCACGNQCAIIPRKADGEPEDGELSELGVDFHDYVRDYDFDRALKTLEKIEKTSTEIINNMIETAEKAGFILAEKE